MSDGPNRRRGKTIWLEQFGYMRDAYNPKGFLVLMIIANWLDTELELVKPRPPGPMRAAKAPETS